MTEGLDMAPANDIKAARATYEGFINLIKMAVPVIVVIVAFVIYLIH
jgi:tRNA threonylcarbamoyladenosine modification (KEOPS) complex  Pcc1 subunit